MLVTALPTQEKGPENQHQTEQLDCRPVRQFFF
jgi:hypothetical protein